MFRMIPILTLILLAQGDGNVEFEEDLFSNFTFINSTNSTTTITTPESNTTDTIIFALKVLLLLAAISFTVWFIWKDRHPSEEALRDRALIRAAREEHDRRRRQNREENIPMNDI
ncbi:unnamed protein product [Caenorhabditis nigoni]